MAVQRIACLIYGALCVIAMGVILVVFLRTLNHWLASLAVAIGVTAVPPLMWDKDRG